MARTDFQRTKATTSFYTDPTDANFERAVVFEPGYSDPGPRDSSWCGKHGMDIRFLLRGPKGVAQFLLSTGWVPGEEGTDPRTAQSYPMGADVGYHARTPQYEDQWGMGACEHFDGDSCYYDGSGLYATEVLAAFRERGADAVWPILREWHDRIEVPA